MKGSQTNPDKRHTFFPDNWTPTQIETEIRASYNNFLTSGGSLNQGWWTARSPSGVMINGKINEATGMVETAFPLFGK
ncbi:EndoU domain-containing protein [Hahella ganghwensis]|uniref:EndoU domain-containing protein n=1 Tax=Hahella ganghwensis TaxID=286420 RepID=UPI0009FFB0E1